MSGPQGDRDESQAIGRYWFLRTQRQRKAALATGCLGVLVLLGMGIYTAANDQGPASKASDAATTLAQTVPAPAEPAPAAARPVTPEPAAKPAPPAVVAATPQPAPAVVAGSVDYVRYPSISGERFFSRPAGQEADKASDLAHAGNKASDETRVAFKGAVMEGAKAGKALHQQYLMLPQLIPCVLKTAMDSTLAGAIMCDTTVDVLSPDHIVLMPAGTHVTGTYKNDVRRGQNRLFAFAGWAMTPEGIPVPLNSSVADGVGRAGIPGDVDNHYGERFGAGILLSGSDSAMKLAQAMVSKGGNQYLDLNTGSGAGGIAEEILRSQIDIAPTITVPPGTMINIVVDHPISFDGVINVKAIN